VRALPEVPDVYAVLGVPPDADGTALRAAHRQLVRRHHPDLRPPEERVVATRRVQDVNMAYGLVRDDAARARYDALRTALADAERAQRHARPGYAWPATVGGAVADLDVRWQALSRTAGRWAGRWWGRNRAPMARAAVRAGGTARRVAADTVGRVLWLLSCLGGAAIGFLAATAASGLAGVGGGLTTVVGLVAGGLAGSDRGWRRRLRMAGLDEPDRWGRLTVPLAGSLVAAALVAELLLGR